MFGNRSRARGFGRGRGRGGARYKKAFDKKVAARRAIKAARKNNKSNYPYTWNDEVVAAQLRGKDASGSYKIKLSPEATPISRLDEMRDGYIPEIKRLVNDYQSGKKLKKKDKMKVDNYLTRVRELEENDMLKLKKNGLTHTPTTDLCRTIKILEYLKKFYLADKKNGCMTIYLRLMEESFSKTIVTHPKLMDSYGRAKSWMDDYVKTQDIIQYQLVTKHEIMPPLNVKGFVKLDTWQERAIDLMRERKSTILSIPTSGGKTYLSAYLTKSSGKIIFMVPPAPPLARQVAAYLTRITGTDVPFLTGTYRPKLYHSDVISLIERSKIVVTTPDVFLDYLPEVGGLREEDNLIIDEIHMLGSNEGDSMEMVSILNSKAMLLGLSATVSNPEDLIKWRKNLCDDDLTIVSSNKRFFNLQTAYWDTTTKSVVPLNPLSMVSVDDFVSGNILNKDLKPTPPDIHQLATLLEREFGEEMENLRLSVHFADLYSRRVTLMEVMDYFNMLLKFMVDKSSSNSSKIEEILTSFAPVELEEEETNLLDIITTLKETKNTPALVFERNTYSLMRIARKLIEDIDRAEMKKYPERLKEWEKQTKEAKKRQKEMEKAGLIAKCESGLSDGKSSKDKAELGRVERMRDNSSLEEIIVEHFQKPTDSFNWCHQTKISHAEIEEIEFKLKKYFPRDGDFYHPIIHALWRGIGVYAEGLPDDYLVQVQVMANEKKLGVVLSDKSMTFGVSMPFRNVVIYRDPSTKDELNPLLFKQMEGRAGRRGQDTKGSVIFAGYSWDRIEELSVSEIPKIEGQDSIENLYLPIGARLAKLAGKTYDFEKVLTHNLSRQQNEEEDETTWKDYEEMWETWAPEALAGDMNKLRMLWHSRNYGCDGISFYHLIDELEKKFSGGDIGELRQVTAGHILSFFIQNKRAKKVSNILIKPDDYDTSWRGIRHKLLEMGIPLEDEDYLDGRIWASIRGNVLVSGTSDEEYQEIREDFFKFACSLRIIQNYCYYTSKITLTRILGKLFTRCKWILWNSSPLINFGKEIKYEAKDDDEDVPDEDYEDDEPAAGCGVDL